MSNMRAVFLSVFMFATMSIWAKAQLFVPGEDWSTSTDWSVSGVEWSSSGKMNYFTKKGENSFLAFLYIIQLIITIT